MEKKAKPQHEEQGDVWLLSYSDLMTLLACFFILLMVFANYEEPGSNAVAKQIADSINKVDNKTSDIKMQEVSQEIAKHPELLKKTKISVTNQELQVTFSSSVLFPEKSVDLSDDIEPTLQSLIDIIRSKDVNFRVVIEGHSDPYEFREMNNIGSAWELGAIRASRVLSKFESFGFDPNKIVAVTKGDSEPLEPNKDETGSPIPENMILNRRVVIKVLEPVIDAKKVKFGLGIYFNEKLND